MYVKSSGVYLQVGKDLYNFIEYTETQFSASLVLNPEALLFHFMHSFIYCYCICIMQTKYDYARPTCELNSLCLLTHISLASFLWDIGKQ